MKSTTPLVTIVEDFALAAMRLAKYDAFEGGGVMAWLPGLAVVGVGADVHDASIDLYTKLEGSVHVWLARGSRIPVLDGINLNVQREAALSTYTALPAEPEGTFYENEKALETAFAEHDAARKRAQPTGRRKLRATRSASR